MRNIAQLHVDYLDEWGAEWLEQKFEKVGKVGDG